MQVFYDDDDNIKTKIKDWNFIIVTNDMWHLPYWKIGYAQTRMCHWKWNRYFETLWYKWITKSRPEDEIVLMNKEEKSCHSVYSNRPLSESQRKMLRKVLKTCCHSDSGEKPPIRAGVRNLARSKMIFFKYFFFKW